MKIEEGGRRMTQRGRKGKEGMTRIRPKKMLMRISLFLEDNLFFHMPVISPINTEAIKESAKNTVKSVVDWLNPLTHIRNLISNVRDTICKKVPLLSLILKKFESKEKTTEQESFGERLERGARETTKAVAKPMMSPEQYEQALKGSGEKAPETKNYYEKPEALQKVKNE